MCSRASACRITVHGNEQTALLSLIDWKLVGVVVYLVKRKRAHVGRQVVDFVSVGYADGALERDA